MSNTWSRASYRFLTALSRGRLLSFAFLRQPSKRQYPDYYVLIPHPIALEDIRKQIDNDAYSSLEAVKRDFDLCFKNAREYNVKTSEIWNDAKELQVSRHLMPLTISNIYTPMLNADENTTETGQ